MADLRTSVTEAFRHRFGALPVHVVRAPGRVNLIGEHTDYNDGFVMPLAIEQAVWLAVRPRDDDRVILHSTRATEPADFRIGTIERGTGWGEYAKGVAWALQAQGHRLSGLEGVLVSDVPEGAGLSSSAALELAVARAFAASAGLDWVPAAMARTAQRAENEWVGVRCGVMDQMASACGVAGHAVLLDCRSLAVTPTPLPAWTTVLVLDTGTRRGLVDSAYNARRETCERVAHALGVPALRDATLDGLQVSEGALTPTQLHRARHVVTENARVLAAAEAMRQGDAARLGALMAASHASLRDDYEVSSPALDAFADAARAQNGCYGARMTGAGFGGCVVALVASDRAEAVAEAATRVYRRRTGHEPTAYRVRAVAGASLEPVPVLSP